MNKLWKLALVFSILFSSSTIHSQDCEKNLVGKLDVLPPDIVQTLSVAATAFCQEQARLSDKIFKVRVTGSIRSVNDQAGYLLQCMKRNGCSIYENQEAVAEYKAIKNLTKKKLEFQIKDQLKRNCFISKHLSNRAVDIGTRSMPQKVVLLLAKLISETEYHYDGKKFKPIVINKSHGTGPHLHINFKPYYFDPGRCPKEYSFDTH